MKIKLYSYSCACEVEEEFLFTQEDSCWSRHQANFVLMAFVTMGKEGKKVCVFLRQLLTSSACSLVLNRLC